MRWHEPVLLCTPSRQRPSGFRALTVLACVSMFTWHGNTDLGLLLRFIREHGMSAKWPAGISSDMHELQVSVAPELTKERPQRHPLADRQAKAPSVRNADQGSDRTAVAPKFSFTDSVSLRRCPWRNPRWSRGKCAPAWARPTFYGYRP